MIRCSYSYAWGCDHKWPTHKNIPFFLSRETGTYHLYWLSFLTIGKMFKLSELFWENCQNYVWRFDILEQWILSGNCREKSAPTDNKVYRRCSLQTFLLNPLYSHLIVFSNCRTIFLLSNSIFEKIIYICFYLFLKSVLYFFKSNYKKSNLFRSELFVCILLSFLNFHFVF